jgi:hypothetical protein
MSSGHRTQGDSCVLFHSKNIDVLATLLPTDIHGHVSTCPGHDICVSYLKNIGHVLKGHFHLSLHLHLPLDPRECKQTARKWKTDEDRIPTSSHPLQSFKKQDWSFVGHSSRWFGSQWWTSVMRKVSLYYLSIRSEWWRWFGLEQRWCQSFFSLGGCIVVIS